VSVEIEIAEVMRSCGLMPPRYITFDGKIHRLGKNKSSWCVFFDGHVKAGAFGDWKTGVNEKYVEARLDITPKDRQRIAQQMREAAAQRERELQVSHQQAVNTCSLIWGSAEESGTNDYLTSKGLSPPISDYGLRQGKGSFGTYTPFGDNEVSLIVPSVDVDGTLHSLQFVSTGGRKRFYPGGKLKGHFCHFGLIDNPVKILIAEGVATALTLFEDSGFPVVAAFNCGNLAAVAETIRWKYFDTDILICADDDHTTEGNPGCAMAAEAAVRIGCDWVPPDFTGLPRGPKDTDFNDLKRLKEAGHE
jgi:putative DNA primase/helicase